MKSFVLFLLCSGSLLLVGCREEKPANSETQSQPLTKADAMNSNQANNSSVNPVAQLEQEAKAAGAQQNSNAGEAKKYKIPAFIDTVKGGITDLPAYKGARIYNMQYGPIQGADSAMIIYMTGDPMEKVAAFYNGIVKSHGWKVISTITEPETVDMKFVKGSRDEAIVRIKKNTEQRVTEILLSRVQKPLEDKPK
jgi:hypothetical protein